MERLTKEMHKAINELYEAVGYDCDACCEQCPYAEACEANELFWGCGVWEDSMGEDL